MCQALEDEQVEGAVGLWRRGVGEAVFQALASFDQVRLEERFEIAV
jgi:hypothetical protein